jgi:Rrf2 family protein
MKLITRDTDYALRAVVFISRNKEKVVPVTAMVKALKIPHPFLRKILQVLSHKGILRSVKGPGGGFALAKPSREIRLTELMRVFQGPLRINECLFKGGKCPNERTCVLRKKINRIEEKVAEELHSITIGSLL